MDRFVYWDPDPSRTTVTIMQQALHDALRTANLPLLPAFNEPKHQGVVRIRIMRNIVAEAQRGIRDLRVLSALPLRKSMYCCIVDGKEITPR
jgi:hypothetical protein